MNLDDGFAIPFLMAGRVIIISWQKRWKMLINWMELKRTRKGEFYIYLEELPEEREDLPPPYWRFSPMLILQYKRGNKKTDEKMKDLIIKLTVEYWQNEFLKDTKRYTDLMASLTRVKR